MKIKKIFLLKTFGLFGFILSLTSVISFTVNYVGYSNGKDINSIFNELGPNMPYYFLIFIFAILFFALFLVGLVIEKQLQPEEVKKSRTLQYQVVGSMLLVIIILSLPYLYINVHEYFLYKNNYQQTIRRQILIAIISNSIGFIIQGLTAAILFFISVYGEKQNNTIDPERKIL